MSYIDAAALKTYLNITTTGDDTLLGLLAARAQEHIEAYTHRRFEADEDATRGFDAVRDVQGRVLFLDHDLCAITSVVCAGTTIPATAYTTEPRNRTPYHAITLLGSQGYTWSWSTDPEDAISITGRWAYATSAPGDIIHATLELAAYCYKKRENPNYDVVVTPFGSARVPGGMPKHVAQVLSGYVRRIR